MHALSEWYSVQTGRPGRPRVFCFPFAGGGTSVFRGWAEGLGEVAEVVAARPPGRESRIAEPAIDDVGRLVAAATDAILAVVEKEPRRRFALFGHSLGGLVAFEMGRELTRRGAAKPAAVFVSGHAAPGWRSSRRPIGRLPHEQFLAGVGELAGTAKEVLADRELMELLLPMLRADMIAAEEYERIPGPPLGVPLYLYGGTDDEAGTEAALAGWREQAVRPPITRVFDGGHFFIDAARAAVLQKLSSDLREVFAVS